MQRDRAHLPASENDFLLDRGDVFERDLGSEIASGDHDDVSNVDDFRQGCDAIVRLHLGYYVDGMAGVLGFELSVDVGSHIGDDVGVPDERNSDKVYLHA